MTENERADLITNLQTITGDPVRITVPVVSGALEYRVTIGKARYRAPRLDNALMAALTDVAADHATNRPRLRSA